MITCSGRELDTPNLWSKDVLQIKPIFNCNNIYSIFSYSIFYSILLLSYELAICTCLD